MEIIFHVGLHKTGTTFLQRNVFSKIKNINLYCTDGQKFDIDSTILNEDKINLISDESLSGEPFRSKEFQSEEIGLKLANKYPDSKIIVTFRNKEKWMKSLYNQYVKSGGKKTFDKWKEKTFNQEYLDFEKYEKFLKKNFKEVLVLSFEELKSNPDDYIQKICDFIGAEVPEYENKLVGFKLSQKQIDLIRILNYLPIKPQLIYYKLDTIRTKNQLRKKY